MKSKTGVVSKTLDKKAGAENYGFCRKLDQTTAMVALDKKAGAANYGFCRKLDQTTAMVALKPACLS